MATLAEVEQAITALGEGTPEYHEALAFYCLTMARAQWRIADKLALDRRRREANAAFARGENIR